MTYTKKVVKGSSLIFLMTILAGAVAYGTRVFMARSLSVEDYGLFYAVFTFVIFFLFFRDLGMPQALAKFVAQYNAEGREDKVKTVIFSCFTLQLVGSVLFSVIFLLMANYLAGSYFKSEIAGTILIWMILYVLGSVLFIVLKSVFLGYHKVFLFSSMELVKNVVVFLVLLFFFFFHFGDITEIYVPVVAYVTVSFVLFIVYLPFLLRMVNFSVKMVEFRLISKELFYFSIPVFFTAVGAKVIGYMDTLLLTYFRSLVEVGVYNVVLPSAMVFLDIGASVSILVLPLASELWVKKDYRRLSEGVRLAYKYIFIVFIPAVVVCVVYAKEIVGVLFGTEYLSGVFAFQILLIGVLLYIVALFNHSLLTGLGKPAEVTKIILFSGAANLGLNLVLIPFYGFEAAAFVTAVSYGLALLLSTNKVSRIVKISFPWRQWSLLFGFSALWTLLIYGNLFSYFDFSAVTVINAVSVHFLLFLGWVGGYVCFLYFSKLISVEEIKRYYRLVRRVQ